MTLLYKIISKLLANTLKPFMPFLVDEEQTGFIAGRQILDNILAFRVGKDYLKSRRLFALFIMWDFFKAYDHLAHIFVWETLSAMGFSPSLSKLVQGLVIGGMSVIHANGLFSRMVDLSRGVRQGCSLAPFLFVLTLQPLMAILKKRVADGLIRGIPLTNSGDKKLLYRHVS